LLEVRERERVQFLILLLLGLLLDKAVVPALAIKNPLILEESVADLLQQGG